VTRSLPLAAFARSADPRLEGRLGWQQGLGATCGENLGKQAGEIARCPKDRGKTGQAAGRVHPDTVAADCRVARWPFHREIVVDSGPPGCKVGRLEMLKGKTQVNRIVDLSRDRYSDPIFAEASSINSATSFGWESIARWLDGSAIDVAFILAASNFSMSGLIARSFAPITNQDGFVFHAAVVMVAPKAAAFVGPCVAVTSSFSEGERSCAKSSAMPFGVMERKPCASGRTSGLAELAGTSHRCFPPTLLLLVPMLTRKLIRQPSDRFPLQ
jgi:hypothetical protein